MQSLCENCHNIFPILKSSELNIATCNFCSAEQTIPEFPWSQKAILGFRYKIIEAIGRGGHGYVCICRDLIDDLNVVLKIYHREKLKPHVIDSFMLEAEDAKKFNHPNIVKSYGGNVDGTVLYIVQDWICGMDLVKYQRKIGDFTLNQLMYILLKVTKALKYLWEDFEIVHRDIKPENIMLNHLGEVFLTDFGIMTKTLEKDDSEQLFCTPEYVPPETAAGIGRIDFRSDQFSLGATFFRMVAKKHAFSGYSVENLIMKRLKWPIPHLKDYSNIPNYVGDMIYKMMAVNSNDRFQDIEEIIDYIEQILNTLPAGFEIQQLENSYAE
ncbi:MAG: serine/threonine protein kinase [Lentisphaeraceae bacterium]|nr:serine/threonine protein kinase [Lentisphaeraceae bacterium]